MSAALHSNTDLEEIAFFLKRKDSFVICGHVNPDPDCLSSQLALSQALRQMGKKVTCVLAQKGGIAEPFQFLPGAKDMVPACDVSDDIDVFIAVDVPKRDRLGEDACKLLDRAQESLRIDHHATEMPLGHHFFCDPSAASTSLLIWHLCQILKVDCRGPIAQCCYAGLVGDTGGFQFQNTNAECLRYASQMVEYGADPALVSLNLFMTRSRTALLLESRAVQHMRFGGKGTYVISWLTQTDYDQIGASKEDSEGIIDALRSLSGVRVAVLLREQDGRIRGSIRSKDDYDVASHARHWNGGGHRAAAGFTFDEPLSEALRTVDAELSVSLGSRSKRPAISEDDYREIAEKQIDRQAPSQHDEGDLPDLKHARHAARKKQRS